jgi:hypothetical protein
MTPDEVDGRNALRFRLLGVLVESSKGRQTANFIIREELAKVLDAPLREVLEAAAFLHGKGLVHLSGNGGGSAVRVTQPGIEYIEGKVLEQRKRLRLDVLLRFYRISQVSDEKVYPLKEEFAECVGATLEEARKAARYLIGFGLLEGFDDVPTHANLTQTGIRLAERLITEVRTAESQGTEADPKTTVVNNYFSGATVGTLQQGGEGNTATAVLNTQGLKIGGQPPPSPSPAKPPVDDSIEEAVWRIQWVDFDEVLVLCHTGTTLLHAIEESVRSACVPLRDAPRIDKSQGRWRVS